MIVRCTSCNSAFAVDDSKVAQKKFAFTCPKCAFENVIDNREKKEAAVVLDEAVPAARGGGDMRPGREKPAPPQDDIFGLMEDSERPAGRDGVGDSGLDEPLDLLDEPVAEKKAGASKQKDDDFGLDLDLDTDFDEAPVKSQKPSSPDEPHDVPLDDFDLDSLDLDVDSGPDKKKSTRDEVKDELDDLDLGDIDMDAAEPAKKEEVVIKDELDEFTDLDEAINLDDFEGDLNLDDTGSDIIDDFEPLPADKASAAVPVKKSGDRLSEDIKTEKLFPSDEAEDESITIDLDSLDIDLDETEGAKDKQKRKREDDFGMDTGVDADERHGSDEDITLDLETLDIDLSEDTSVKQGEAVDDLSLDFGEIDDKPKTAQSSGDDESVTLDLDSLDIALDENIEVKEGEIVDEDEKLTLEDAGLTLDELTADEISSVSVADEIDDVEDIKLTIDEIDPTLTVDQIENELKSDSGLAAPVVAAKSKKSDEGLILDEFEDLPDIDFDLDEPAEFVTGAAAVGGIAMAGARDRQGAGGIKRDIPDLVVKGEINFSIDYSIRYSRVRAALRLLCIFALGLLPHYVVFSVYSVLSLILGSLNNIIIILTGKSIEDFSQIQENTLRYLLSISASFVGVVEETPIYAGRDNIDYALQMKVIYPFRPSRLLAGLRLSVIGIFITTLPHLLVLGILSLVMVFLYFAGIIGVLVTGRWPGLLFDIFTRYYRYAAGVMGFVIGIVDAYPSFKLK